MEHRRPVRPGRLRPGDPVAVLSPSWGGPHAFPHVFESGLATLREWGLVVREYPTTRAPDELLRREPRRRAEDLNAALRDPTIRAIFASIGGDDSIRLLPFLDTEAAIADPKILMGYSDATTLLLALRRAGLVTFHGPSVMAGLSQAAALGPAFGSHVRGMLFDPTPTYTYAPFAAWSEGYPDWRDPSNVGLVGPAHRGRGWSVLQGRGRVTGELFGGCIEVLDWLRGSPAWPVGDEWDGRLLFFETSEERPTPVQVQRILRALGVAGVFERIVGVMVGRARDLTPEEKVELGQVVVAVIAEEFGRPDLPIVADLDFGHTDPQWVLPIGVRAELDVDARTLRLVEPWLA